MQRLDDRIGGAQDAKRRGHVAVDDRVPLLVGHLLDHVVPRVAGIVDDDVDALEVLIAVLTKRSAKSGAVTLPTQATASRRSCFSSFDRFVGRIGVEVVDDDARAFARPASARLRGRCRGRSR